MRTKVHSLFTGAFEQREIILSKDEEVNLGSNPSLFQTIRVITGTGLIFIDGKEKNIKTDDLIQILPESNVRIKSTGNFSMELFITSSGHI